MKEEVFDVVNDRDEVIGRRPRSGVYRLGLMHRAVPVLVFNAAGEVFLQKIAATKRPKGIDTAVGSRQDRHMLGEPKNQFARNRAALSGCGRAQSKFLSVVSVSVGNAASAFAP